MKLFIYSLQSAIFDGEVKSLTLPTLQGEITVLEDHLPLITLINRGLIRYIDSANKPSTLDFAGGVAEIRPGSEIVILAD